MNARADPEGDAARSRFEKLLRRAGDESRTLAFWWRDDDARTVTPELERLLALAARHELPLALAVIPEGATKVLAQRLRREPSIRVLQHGFRHERHSPDGEKKMELGDHRPLGEVLGELGAGSARLAGLFGEKFLPILTPPWNRISPRVQAALPDIGLAGMSAFGHRPLPAPHDVNTHVDVFAWKPARRPLTRAALYSALCREVEARVAGRAEAIGMLTHHLVHDAESWDRLEEFFALTARHAAIAWPKIDDLFGFEEKLITGPEEPPF